MIKRITLLSILLLSSTTFQLHAQNYIAYEADVSESNLINIIRQNYFVSINNCGSGRPGKNCMTLGFEPPSSPEIWYFINDDVSEFIKYIAEDSNGNLVVSVDYLSQTEKYYSDIAKATRQDTWNRWQAVEEKYPAYEDFTSKISATYFSGCQAQDQPENADSPFDYFHNEVLATQVRDIIMVEFPNINSAEVNSVNVGLVGISFGLSWEIAGTRGTVNMADGGRLVFTLHGQPNVRRPVLDLFESRTHNNVALDTYFSINGLIENNSFTVKPIEIEHGNNCDSQEYIEAAHGINPSLFQETVGVGGTFNFGSCRPHPHFGNYWEVTTIITTTYLGGTSTTTYTTSRIPVGSGGSSDGCK